MQIMDLGDYHCHNGLSLYTLSEAHAKINTTDAFLARPSPSGPPSQHDTAPT